MPRKPTRAEVAAERLTALMRPQLDEGDEAFLIFTRKIGESRWLVEGTARIRVESADAPLPVGGHVRGVVISSDPAGVES